MYRKLFTLNILFFIVFSMCCCLIFKSKNISKQTNEVENEVEITIETIDEIKNYRFYNIPLTENEQIIIQDIANIYNLSYELILAIIKVESNFNQSIISKTNDFGIMQMNSPTFIWCAEQLKIENADPLDFEINIRCGLFYLDYIRNYWVKYGTPDEYLLMHTICAYHKGINGLLHSLENNTYDINYVDKVIDYKFELERGLI